MITAVLIFATLLLSYAIGSYLLFTLPVVEAGPIGGVSSTGVKRIPLRIESSYVEIINGKKYDFRRFVVQGNCMACRGINPQEIVDVRIFHSEDEKKSIKQNDIVLISLNDEKFRGYKVRAVSEVYDKVAKTFYYDNQGGQIDSSKNHALQDIIGIVEKESYSIA